MQEDVVPLNLKDPDVYFKTDEAAPAAPPAVGAVSTVAFLESIDPSNLPIPPCDPALSLKVLEELSTGSDAGLVARFGPLAAGVSGVAADVALLPGLLSLLRAEALRTQELLRHFWSALRAPADAGRRERLGGLARALHEQLGRLEAHMAAGPAGMEQIYATILLEPWKKAIGLAQAEHVRDAARYADTALR